MALTAPTWPSTLAATLEVLTSQILTLESAAPVPKMRPSG